MSTKRVLIRVCFLISLFGIIDEKIACADWRTECVDCPKEFQNAYPRSLAFDSLNRPHVAFGKNGVYHAYHDGTHWVFELIDATLGIGQYTSLTIDKNDKVHIAYPDNTAGNTGTLKQIKYATNASGSWVVTGIDTDISWWGLIKHTSIAVDSQGKAHISYTKWYGSISLIYLTNQSGDWVFKTVDTTGEFDITIAVDANDKVHIAYQDATVYQDGDLKYATNASGDWVITTVDALGNAAEYSCLAIDSNNHAHICYTTYTVSGGTYTFYLRYATNASGSWAISLISLSYPQYISLAVDSNNKVHIGYSGVQYATNASGSWVITTVDSTGDSNVSLAVNSSGAVGMSYGATSSSFKYATNASGSWVTSFIYEYNDAGRYTSIGVDANKKVHISHYDATNKNLRYATNASGTWDETVIDSTDDVGTSSALAVDSQNKIHIAYFDSTQFVIKYATNASGSWQITTVDNTLSEGLYFTEIGTSMAIDGSDKIHISYSSGVYGGKLKYATNASGSWVVTDLNTLANSHTSIALDSTGKVHIVYNYQVSRYSNQNLRYATNATGSWVITDIASNTGYGALVIDTNDKVHIVYTLSSGAQYLSNASGSWVTTTLATGVYYYPSMARDASNNLHVALQYQNTKDLYYATNASGSWVLSSIDSTDAVGAENALAVDADNNIHISYYTATYHSLKYATTAPASCSNTWYRDADGDGYGDAGQSVEACTAPDGYVASSSDCNDGDAAVNPVAVEVCDEIDNNCSGDTDEGVKTVYYPDADGDGYGDGSQPVETCSSPDGYMMDNTDCDDGKIAVNPNSLEIAYNGIDDDCNAATPDDDADGDGISDSSDNCPNVYNPGQSDLDGDGSGDVCDDETVLSDARTISAGEFRVKRLTINNNALITLQADSSAEGYKGIKIYAENLIIETGSVLSADGLGYISDSGPGAGAEGVLAGSGAGYGGKGGSTLTADGGATYGSSLAPTDPGSGGGTGTSAGGAGGGAVWIVVSSELVVDGTITANGNNSDGNGGSGSGGSIYITTDYLGGWGTISANGGGNLISASGGGGRIAVYSQSSDFSGSFEAKGGTGLISAEDGTVEVSSNAPSTETGSSEQTSTQKTFVETIFAQKGTISSATVSGSFSGTLNFSSLKMVKITSGTFSGKGFTTGEWNGTVNGQSCEGTWKGMLYLNADEKKVYVKGAVAGDIAGIVEGYLTESTADSGVYDNCSSTWRINKLNTQELSATITVSGVIAYETGVEYGDTELYALQTSVEGTAVGNYAGPLDTVLTHVRVNSMGNPYYREGFAVLYYVSPYGQGEGWAYGKLVSAGRTELKGLFESPLLGIASGTLDETVSPRSLTVSIERIDTKLPALPNMKVVSYGKNRVSSGETLYNLIEYRNDGIGNAENVVVVHKFPAQAILKQISDNGIYRWDTNEVIWKLGTVSPKSKGYLYVCIKIPYGTSVGTKLENISNIATTSTDMDYYLNPDAVQPFDIQEYLAYEPVQIISSKVLTMDEVNAELTGDTFLDLHRYCMEQGFYFTGIAVQGTYMEDHVITQFVMENPDTQGNILLTKINHSSSSMSYLLKLDSDNPSISNRGGGLSYNKTSGAIEYWGDWSPHSCPSTAQCFVNCIWNKYSGVGFSYLIDQIVNLGGEAIKAVWAIKSCLGALTCGQTFLATCSLNCNQYTYAHDYMQCNRDCDSQVGVACDESLNTCISDTYGTFLGLLGDAAKMAIDMETAKWGCLKDCLEDKSAYSCEPGETQSHCASWNEKLWYGGDIVTLYCDENCIMGGIYGAPGVDKTVEACPKDTTCVETNGNAECRPKEEVPDRDNNTDSVITGHDPNAKYGPEGNVVQGQRLTYRVEFENEGEGIAFGVYFTDTLDEKLDDATLEIGPVFDVKTGEQIGEAGKYDPATRTIIWLVGNEGEIGPGKGGYGEYSIDVRTDISDGTAILNIATVYFPSVPEQTKTNAVVNKVGFDPDNDTIIDSFDNCPDTYNPNQKDTCKDGIGDACRTDTDQDTIPDDCDNCPQVYNTAQKDTCHDGIGDLCRADTDQDRIPDDCDNCPSVANTDQADTDGDGMGDACEEQSAVTLASFEAEPGNNKVTLVWVTGDETNNFGFNVYRADFADGAYTKLNASVLASQSVSGEGASYVYVDDTVENRKTYYYKLQDIDSNGAKTMHGPVSATPRLLYGLSK